MMKFRIFYLEFKVKSWSPWQTDNLYMNKEKIILV